MAFIEWKSCYWSLSKKGVYEKVVKSEWKRTDGQTYSFPIDIIPCKRPLLPPKTGSKANSKPTAQSWDITSGRGKIDTQYKSNLRAYYLMKS